jgi:hypothetical protein
LSVHRLFLANFRLSDHSDLFFLAPLRSCATSDRVARKRKIPQPNKHFRLVMWFLLYRVHAQLPINREVEVIACESRRMPVEFFDRFKAEFSHHWNQMVEKRARRLAIMSS